MAQHTQGKWEIKEIEGDCTLILNSNGYCIASLPCLSFGKKIPQEITQANARLIASAPELLEACKMVDIILNNKNVTLPKDKRITKQQAMDLLSQAIAKAEGK